MSIFKADLHIHTNRSYDCLQTPSQIVQYAIKADLDALAITDHNVFWGHKRIKELSDKLIIISGMEIRTDDYGDLLALFIKEEIESRTFVEAVEEIHDQGGIAVLPHPFRKVTEFPNEIFASVDAVEVLNARSKPRNNSKAEKLAEAWDLPELGNSDAHTPWEVGQATTVIEGSVNSEDDILDAILLGNVRPAGDVSPYYLYHGLSLAMETYKSIR